MLYCQHINVLCIVNTQINIEFGITRTCEALGLSDKQQLNSRLTMDTLFQMDLLLESPS